MTDETPTVKITLDTIYNTLLEVKSKLDPLPDKTEDHEKRIRTIEKQMWRWAGATALGSILGTQVLNKFMGNG